MSGAPPTPWVSSAVVYDHLARTRHRSVMKSRMLDSVDTVQGRGQRPVYAEASAV